MCLVVLSADGVSAGQRVQRPRVTGSRDAAQASAAVSRVNAAGLSSPQRAGHAASAARLSEHLGTVRGHGGTGVQLLLRAWSAADGLRPDHRRQIRRTDEDAHQQRKHTRPSHSRKRCAGASICCGVSDLLSVHVCRAFIP